MTKKEEVKLLCVVSLTKLSFLSLTPAIASYPTGAVEESFLSGINKKSMCLVNSYRGEMGRY